MNSHKPIHAVIPGLGQRSLKTALATAVLAFIYFILRRNPTFACVGVIFGMGNGMEDSKQSGGNRLIGTIIGGLLGIGIMAVERWIFPQGGDYLKVVLIVFGIILLVCLSVMFHWPGAVQPGGVVLCIILFNTPSDYIDYAFDRMLDTAVGVIFAIVINHVLGRNRVDKWLKRIPQEAKGQDL